MIKLFILVVAFGMPWPCECDERRYTSEEVVKAQCENAREIKPRVTFYWKSDEAIREYNKVSRPDRARLYSVSFSKILSLGVVEELSVVPTYGYEVVGSSTITFKGI